MANKVKFHARKSDGQAIPFMKTAAEKRFYAMYGKVPTLIELQQFKKWKPTIFYADEKL